MLAVPSIVSHSPDKIVAQRLQRDTPNIITYYSECLFKFHDGPVPHVATKICLYAVDGCSLAPVLCCGGWRLQLGLFKVE